jgi:hypothetical protein
MSVKKQIMNNKNRDLVFFIVDRKDWALGTMANEMAESLAKSYESVILSENEISNNRYHAWRLSRKAKVIHFLGQYIATGYCWPGDRAALPRYPCPYRKQPHLFHQTTYPHGIPKVRRNVGNDRAESTIRRH